MIKEFLKSIIADYERLFVSKVIMIFCLVSGLMAAVLILAVLLMLSYPAYRWCVFGSFIIVWVLALLALYGYQRIVRAEQQARMTQLESIEQLVQVGTTIVTNVMEHFGRSKNESKRQQKKRTEERNEP